MEKFTCQVVLTVEVEAFDESEALDMVRDTLGVGDMYGVDIIEAEVGLNVR